jgi:hypothetical protein
MFYSNNAPSRIWGLLERRSAQHRGRECQSEHRQGLENGNRQDIGVGLPMSQSRDRKESDDGPVVRQSIHATCRHRGDPVEQLWADSLRLG